MNENRKQINIVIDQYLLGEGDIINLKVSSDTQKNSIIKNLKEENPSAKGKYNIFALFRKNRKKDITENIESYKKNISLELIDSQENKRGSKNFKKDPYSKTNSKSTEQIEYDREFETKNNQSSSFFPFKFARKSKQENKFFEDSKTEDDKVSINPKENNAVSNESSEQGNQVTKTSEKKKTSERISHTKINGKPSYSLFVLSLFVFIIISIFELREKKFADAIFFIFLGITLSANWLYFKYLSLLEKLIILISALSAIAIFIIILFRGTIYLS